MNEMVKIQESETEQIEKALEAMKHPDVNVDNTPNLVVVNKYSSDPNITKHPYVFVEASRLEFRCTVVYQRDKGRITPLTNKEIQAQIGAIKEILEPQYINVEFDEDVIKDLQDEITR